LIANQNIIHEVGVTTALVEVKKAVSNMNLEHYKNKVIENSVNIEAYRQTLDKVLASEYVVKMIFSE
jgi:menaquinone-dependent protoporphyrinogen IX oxidase